MGNRIIQMMSFFVFVFLFIGNLAALDDTDEVMIEIEAQKDMLAYVQSTMPSRFGDNLAAGDKVEYIITDPHKREEDRAVSTLQVTSRVGSIATVKEMFEGNTLWYRIDLKNNALLEYWGSDEDGREYKPVLLSPKETETRVKAMHEADNQEQAKLRQDGFAQPIYVITQDREQLSIAEKNISCLVKTLELPQFDGITDELRQAVSDVSKVYFSESVPKLLPVKLMASYLQNPELFAGNCGMVKQSLYQLRSFEKADH